MTSFAMHRKFAAEFSLFQMATMTRRPRGILLCNDDGPPCVKNSPFQHIFLAKLLEHFGYTEENAHDPSDKPEVLMYNAIFPVQLI
jgi:hypothetical protein